MKATNAQLVVARQSSLTYVNLLSVRTFPGKFHCINSRPCYGAVCSSNPGYSRWSEPGFDSKSSKLTCSASHSHPALKADTQDRDHCGVTITTAVHEILQSAHEDTALLSNPDSSADAACLLLACLRHPDCDSLRRRLEDNGIRFNEVQAVLTVALAGQQANAVCTASAAAQTGDNSVKQTTKASTGSSMQGIVYSAMQYAVSKGSDVVKIEDLLYCLTSNRDVVCIATNPIYYAFNQMYGPYDVDKMMDLWLEVLVTARVSSNMQRRLPLYVPEASNLLLWNAIDAAKSPASIAEVLAAFATMGWVPSVLVSTQLWNRLLGTSSNSLGHTFIAESLLAGLATMPIPPTLSSHGTHIASLLEIVIDFLIERSTLTNSSAWGTHARSENSNTQRSSDWLSTLKWNVVFNILACCSRLEAAFPGAIATCQAGRRINSSINMVREEAYGYKHTFNWIMKSLRQSPAEAYLSLTYLQRLRSGSEAPLSSPLLYPAANFQTPSAVAAFHSRLLTMFEDRYLPESYVRDHLSVLCKQRQEVCRLPHTTWARLLRLVFANDNATKEPLSTQVVLEMMYNHLGYIWKNSNAELLVLRLQALKLCQLYLNLPCKQWLWQDVLYKLTYTHDITTVRALLDQAKALELPVAETNTNGAILQQALAHVKLNDLDVKSYLSTITHYSQCAESVHEQQSWKDAAEQFKSVQHVHEGVALPDVHLQLARHIVSTDPEFSTAVVNSEAEAKQPPNLSKVDFLQRLFMERDNQKAMQMAYQAMQTQEARPLDIITWLCMMRFSTEAYNLQDESTGVASLLAAAMFPQALHVSHQHYTIPAVLQRWLPLASQGLSVDVYSEYCQPGSTKDPVTAVPELTTTLTSLISFGQTDVWLGDLPCRILSDISKQTFDQQSKLLWTRFVWCLAVAWGYNQLPTTMNPLDDEQVQRLQDVLSTAGEDQPAIQTLLMLTATACQFQTRVANADNSSPPIIHQLFVASSKAAISRLAALKTSNIKDASDDHLLHLSAFALHLSQGCDTTGIHYSSVKVGLTFLLEEMERRMQDQTKTSSATQAGLIGSELNVLVRARAPNPTIAVPNVSPKIHFFFGEIVDYIADTDRYEVKLWPRDETKKGDEHVAAAGNNFTTNTVGFSTTSTSAIPVNRNVSPSNYIHSTYQPLSASGHWAAVARAIKAKL